MKLFHRAAVFVLVLAMLSSCLVLISSAAEESPYLFLSDLQDKIVEKKTEKFAGFDGFFDNRDKHMKGGYTFKKGVTMHPDSQADGILTWDISEYSATYDTFTATVAKYDVAAGRNTVMIVEVDGVEKYNSGKISVGWIDYVKVDIKNAKKLTLKVNNAGDGHQSDMCVWAYASVNKSSELKVKNIQLAGASDFAVAGEDYDISKAVAVVTYNNYTFREVACTADANDSNKVVISGCTDMKVGTQTISLKYEGFTQTKDVIVPEKGKMEYVSEMTWATSTAYSGFNGGKASNQLDADGGFRCQIAGVPAYKVIYTCPQNDKDETKSRAGVSVNLEGKGYTNFHCVAGKPIRGNAKDAQAKYYVIGDGKTLAVSEAIFVGDTWVCDVDITGVKVLEILVSNGGDGSINSDWAVFDDAVVYAKPADPEPPVTSGNQETDPPAPPVTTAPENNDTTVPSNQDTTAPAGKDTDKSSDTTGTPAGSNGGCTSSVMPLEIVIAMICVAGAATVGLKKKKAE